jgi:tetratricopeptide (TPR) repeat protein
MLFLMDEATWHLRARLRLILLALTEGRYTEAEKECLEGAQLADSIGESTWSKDFRGMLGQVLFEQGKIEAALAAVRPTVAAAGNDDSRTRARMYVLGQIYARTGDLAALEDLTNRLRLSARPGAPRPLVREFDLFTGVVEFERGGYREAVAALEKAAAALPTGRPPATYEPLIFCYLGLAREKAGDPAGAAAAFDKILEATNDRLYFGDIFPLAVFGKARAEEALGRQAAAQEGYRSFLALWSQADPGRPEVEKARARLKALSGS